jgi:hypothetical protein
VAAMMAKTAGIASMGYVATNTIQINMIQFTDGRAPDRPHEDGPHLMAF